LIGARIRAIRHLRGMTQLALSTQSKIGVAEVSRAEIGQRLPTLPTLLAIAKGLRVSSADLLDVEPNALPPELVVLLADLRAARPEVQRSALAQVNLFLTTNATGDDEASTQEGEHGV
jgi:transcriptional regulator with XRE-family HTH domain